MIELRPLSDFNVVPFYNWIKDVDVIRYSLTWFQKTRSNKEVKAWYTSLLANSKDYTRGIFLTSDGSLVGYAGICNISDFNKSGEYFILIGNKELWGKGIGTSVSQQIIDYGFEKLNLNRIFLTVSEPNIGGILAYKKAGFKIEGRLRDACFRDGNFHDKIVMSILKSEFNDKTSS